MAGEYDFIATLANTSALLFERLDNINWLGFYLKSHDTLVLGPLHGKVACVRIAQGKGFCGTAFMENRVQRIANVHSFTGHIACASLSRSEIVLPLAVNRQLIGVLDIIDSPIFDRFDEEDENGLKALVVILCNHLKACVIPKYPQINVI
ncbi:GAF domain-containing protein [Arsenophonus endosymbiont of Aphis craccivora]|uniref:GAF domain-containing protein n=1 Tax=Arsenophonus endosymbiont of Aphis craccivora TaxID=1231049 RepID=UPI0015DC0BDD|nr:GAF domain-containing protein [Arsenophonus endosymbiont of Aphis craccivora]QLK87831.1 GAF domain-containing protein [Arsenophonus endosymbiont of Aphis craccivora]